MFDPPIVPDYDHAVIITDNKIARANQDTHIIDRDIVVDGLAAATLIDWLDARSESLEAESLD